MRKKSVLLWSPPEFCGLFGLSQYCNSLDLDGIKSPSFPSLPVLSPDNQPTRACYRHRHSSISIHIFIHLTILDATTYLESPYTPLRVPQTQQHRHSHAAACLLRVQHQTQHTQIFLLQTKGSFLSSPPWCRRSFHSRFFLLLLSFCCTSSPSRPPTESHQNSDGAGQAAALWAWGIPSVQVFRFVCWPSPLLYPPCL
ncbi:hypothetical protein CFIMG_001910RAa [Ceratocystis fimbriata CBS 114723]|uniref:Uncharacterized protein n=1 Tax=Ceratocystis fimbriata CBS 114723 TaxID=1035309 RepID=A0A2C5X6J4_9PEZI|nr:hypothetical protein CFIMG_001910RAa [Ceratocystis fimbriata CBS 114723]